MPRLCLSLLLSLRITSAASAVTMAWTPIGNPGNTCDPQTSDQYPFRNGCFGAVGYAYNIGTYEVTNAQYAEFLNAKAASDPLGLYNRNMGNPTDTQLGHGGITRSGSSGSYAYSTIAGRENLPVNWVDYYDAMRFANWMNNGQGSGDTETGAYTLLRPYRPNQLGGDTAIPNNAGTVTRNSNASIFLPSEDEWYKAAYYDRTGTSYFDYPAGSDAATVCSGATPAANRANCGGTPILTNVGSYSGSASPYGTFDQGGNVYEWNELCVGAGCADNENPFRGARGGAFEFDGSELAAIARSASNAALEHRSFGFRLVLIPEPSTGLLVIAGLLGLAASRRKRA